MKFLETAIFCRRGRTLKGRSDIETRWTVGCKWFFLLVIFPIAASALGERVVLRLPFFEMTKPDYCGEACLQMITAYYGKQVSQNYIHDVMAELRGKDRGIYWSEDLEKTMKKMHILFQGGYRKITNTAGYADDIQCLAESVSKGEPVLIGIISLPGISNKIDESSQIFDHFVVFVGYDLRKKVVYLHDPGGTPFREMSFADFLKHRKNSSNEVYSLSIQGMR